MYAHGYITPIKDIFYVEMAGLLLFQTSGVMVMAKINTNDNTSSSNLSTLP